MRSLNIRVGPSILPLCDRPELPQAGLPKFLDAAFYSYAPPLKRISIALYPQACNVDAAQDSP